MTKAHHVMTKAHHMMTKPHHISYNDKSTCIRCYEKDHPGVL